MFCEATCRIAIVPSTGAMVSRLPRSLHCVASVRAEQTLATSVGMTGQKKGKPQVLAPNLGLPPECRMK